MILSFSRPGCSVPKSVLVAGQIGFNFDGPLINSARHALSFDEALLAEPIRDTQATTAVMAMHNDVVLPMWFQFRKSSGDFAHRQQLGLSDAHGLVLIRFTAIEKHERIASIQASFYLSTRDFDRN